MKKKKNLYLIFMAIFAMTISGCTATSSSQKPSISEDSTTHDSSSQEESSITEESSEAPTSVVEVVQLDAPIISLEGENKIVWNAVENATKYLVNVSEEEFETDLLSFTLEDFGVYDVSVKALPGNETSFSASEFSNVLRVNYFEKFPAPIIDKKDYKSIYWLPVDEVERYQIYVNGEPYGDPLVDTYEFDITLLGYGVYELNVTSVPNEDVARKESEFSNTVILEIMDPLLYPERLFISVKSSLIVFSGDQFIIDATLEDKENSDISYIDATLSASIVNGDSYLTPTEDALVFDAVEVGKAEINVSLDINELVSVIIEVEVKSRPILTLELMEYDTENNEANRMSFNSLYDGRLFYLVVDGESTTVDEIISDGNEVLVSKGENSFIPNLGSNLGEEVNVFFVLLCKVDDVEVGYSEIFALRNVPVKIVPTFVTNVDELVAALNANERGIFLSNDIRVNGTWTPIETVFTGVLDGQGHKIHDINLSGGGTGLFKMIGHKAIIRNLKIDDVRATGFSSARNAIVASRIEKDATVLFDNIVMTNIHMKAQVEGSSRSTAAALVAEYSNETDSVTKIEVRNAYISWRFDIVRNTQVANVGSLFGSFVSKAPNALKLDNVLVDAYFTGNGNNIGGLIGQVGGDISLNNVVTHAEKFDGTNPGSQHGVDYGYLNSRVPTTNDVSNTFFVSYVWDKLQKNEDYTLFDNIDSIPIELLESIEGAQDSAFALVENKLNINLLSKSYELVKPSETKIASPVITLVDRVVSWEKINFATGYEIYINNELVATQTSLSFDLTSYPVGEYDIYVKTIGNGYDLTDSDASDVVHLSIEPILLDYLEAPVAALSGTTLSWNEIDNAISYEVHVNGVLVQNSPALSYDLTTEEYGEYKATIIAIPTEGEYLPSAPSNEVVYAHKYEVSTVLELQNAIETNVGYISLINDLDLDSYSTPSTTFTGILDGNNHELTNLSITVANTGFIKSLGNGSSVRNLSFVDSVVTSNGANMAILAASVAAGAKVEIRNVAIINGLTNSTIVNSSSTQGGLIGSFNNAADEDVQVTLNNVYIDYTHNITRAKVQNNVGAIFGTLNAGSEKALVINNSMVKFMVKGWWSNAATIIGNGSASVEVNSSAIYANFADKNEGSTTMGFDSGNKTTNLTISDALFVSDSEAIFRGTNDGGIVRTSTTIVEADLIQLTNNEASNWLFDSGTKVVTLRVTGKDFTISIG